MENYFEHLMGSGTFSSLLPTTVTHIFLDAGPMFMTKSHVWDCLVNNVSVLTVSCASKYQSHETEADMHDQRERESRVFQS